MSLPVQIKFPGSFTPNYEHDIGDYSFNSLEGIRQRLREELLVTVDRETFLELERRERIISYHVARKRHIIREKFQEGL